MILGVSTHDPEPGARGAVADGADYVAVGSMFPTTTKAGFQLVGPELIRRVRPEIPVPLVAIGGITADNVGEVIRAGADAVAVISAVCAAPDPEAATRAFLERIGRSPAARPDRWARSRVRRLLPLVIAVLSVVTFLPALDGEFLTWDDYVNFGRRTESYRGLGLAQIRWVFGQRSHGPLHPADLAELRP